MNNQLCWFRNDLRVADNKALFNALSKGPTTAIYIATPEQWIDHNDAPIKIDFWRRNLIELKASLKNLNIDLFFFEVGHYKDVAKVFNEIFSKYEFCALHANKEYPINEKQRDLSVAETCKRFQMPLHLYDDQTLLNPLNVFNKSNKPFKVFTPFSKKVRQVIASDTSVLKQFSSLEQQIRKPRKIEKIGTQCSINEIKWPSPKESWQQIWPAGEPHALKRLEQFCSQAISDYKTNRDIPSLDGTSSLSPYLASGIISVRECWQQAQHYLENEGTLTWQNELLWREFYKHVVVHYPYICKKLPWKEKTGAIQWQNDKVAFNQWCQGLTGFPLIDAAMRQLLETGWMHNRLRMITAMFLSKNLLIDWRLGEKWFMQHLIDGDFSANNGGWQWSASTGTDAVPYFRIFNPIRQSQQYDSQGNFIKHYLPELEHIDHKKIHGPITSDAINYPQPIIDLKFSRERALNTFKQLSSEPF